MDDRRRDQLAAYALGALDDAEARELERHLEDCPECRVELDAHLGVTAALAAGVPEVKAPRRVRQGVMAEVRAEADVMKAAGASADRPARRWRIGGWEVRPALAALSAAGVCAAAALGFVIGTGGSPATHRVSAQVAPAAGAGAAGTLETRGSSIALKVTGFRNPGRGRVYQVWLTKPGQRSPTPTHALFTVDQDGKGLVELPRTARGRQVLVTSELDGGSVTGVPSRAPVLSARL